MYIDDFEKRSPNLERLTASRYLGNRTSLLCPSDKTGGWGNWVNPSPLIVDSTETANSVGFGPNRAPEVAAEVAPFSYLNPLGWENAAWERLSKLGGRAGVAACQLHGLGRPNLDQPSYTDFQGIILRAQRDGAVVKREVYWNVASTSPPKSSAAVSAGDLETPEAGFDYPWIFFGDAPLP
jgi:hypothetical protein